MQIYFVKFYIHYLTMVLFRARTYVVCGYEHYKVKEYMYMYIEIMQQTSFH